MLERYELISPGWLWQSEPTGEIMKYDINYVSKFNTYATNDDLSDIRLNYCLSHADFESVMDVGYGNGAFLKTCSAKRFKTFGYDISGYPLPAVIEAVSNPFIETDLVTMFDCIEHFVQRDPDLFLSKLRCKWLCISVPWCHYTDDYRSFQTWKHRKPNEHFHHFDVRGIQELLNRADFDFVTCSSVEDKIRSNNGKLPNILSVMAKKRLR